MKTLTGVIAAAILISSTAMAQYPQGNDDRYNRSRGYEPSYERRQGGGMNALYAVQADLQRVASRGYLPGRDRHRLDQALRSLNDFQRDMDRGRFDKHDLDRAIDRINDVVRHHPFDGREREILIGDMNRLRQVRASEWSYRR